MKSVKILLAAMEICCLIGVLLLSFSVNVEHYFRAALICMFACMAVVLQSEYQDIPWNEESK